jgi:hypothetical protein
MLEVGDIVTLLRDIGPCPVNSEGFVERKSGSRVKVRVTRAPDCEPMTSPISLPLLPQNNFLSGSNCQAHSNLIGAKKKAKTRGKVR